MSNTVNGPFDAGIFRCKNGIVIKKSLPFHEFSGKQSLSLIDQFKEIYPIDQM